MTYKSGTILDISEICDKILEYFYFRKGSTPDVDSIQIELSFPYETFDIAIKNLERDGYIKITRTKSNEFGQITPAGEIFYRTTSYQRLKQSTEEKDKRVRRKENFEVAKGILEIMIGLITVSLTIWTISLDKKITKYDDKVNQLQKTVDSITVTENPIRNSIIEGIAKPDTLETK